MVWSETIAILGVKTLYNRIKINEPFQFQILIELKEKLKDKLEVKFVYIQFPDNPTSDEELEIYEIPSDRVGKFKVNFTVKSPNLRTKKSLDMFDMTLLLIQFRFKANEFTRVGYYVNIELNGPVEKDSDSNIYFLTKNVQRNILTHEPRVTKFFADFN